MLVFVLRHCDRQPDPVDDLAPGGRERAELLARLLGESGASVAYHSGTVRAQRTLEPLQGKLGSAITVEGVASGDPQQTVEAVRSQPADAVVVVVGHSNTVGPIVEALGGPPTSPIATDEFDRIYVVSVGASTEVTLLRYGTPAPSAVRLTAGG
jgi:phosphohistidine phosphatase SixA